MTDTAEEHQGPTAEEPAQPPVVTPITTEMVTPPADAEAVADEVQHVQDVIDAAETTTPMPAPPMPDPGPQPHDRDYQHEVEAELPYLRFDCTALDDEGMAAAAEAARLAVERGELVVLPTDTVYGIGADAFDPDAVQRLLDAKIRGREMPPPVLIGDASLIRALAVDIPRSAEELVEKHWPGPLTVICKARTTLKMDLGETEGTVALRVPDHDVARDLLRRTGPLAVSSANISGMPAAVSCDEAVEQLGGNVAVYLDGGILGGADAAASTIVDFTQDDRGEVLRHGALSLDVLRETLPGLVDLVEPDPDATTAAGPNPDEAEPAALVLEPEPEQREDAELSDQDSVGADLSEQAEVPASAAPAHRTGAHVPAPPGDEHGDTHHDATPGEPSVSDEPSAAPDAVRPAGSPQPIPAPPSAEH